MEQRRDIFLPVAGVILAVLVIAFIAQIVWMY